jgi:hypothetical protein
VPIDGENPANVSLRIAAAFAIPKSMIRNPPDFYLCGPTVTPALDTSLTDAQKVSFWYPHFLVFSSATAANIPNSLLVVNPHQ